MSACPAGICDDTYCEHIVVVFDDVPSVLSSVAPRSSKSRPPDGSTVVTPEGNTADGLVDRPDLEGRNTVGTA